MWSNTRVCHLVTRRLRDGLGCLSWSSSSATTPPGFQTAADRAKELGLVNASELELPKCKEVPASASVVICGGGAQGAAIAYKLAQRGLGPQTVLLEKGEFGQGTTKYSTGMVAVLKQSQVETKLSQISKELYFELESKGFYTGWSQVGSLYLAQTKERLHHFRRLKSQSSLRNVPCEIVHKARIEELCEHVKTDDLEGGLWVPEDGVANPIEICLALAHLASKEGVQIVDHCEVHKVLTEDGAVSGVATDRGFIKCTHFVDTAGAYARYVGVLTKPRVHVPLHTAETYVLHTKPVNWLPPSTPVVRDLDSSVYFRENEGRFLMGGFAKEAIPGCDEIPEEDREALYVDWDHFYPLLDRLLHRCPAMKEARLETCTNSLEPFSPDGNWVLGSAPDIRNYQVAGAMRSIGISAAGGVGEVIADYITRGRTRFDMYNLDLKRFLPMHNNRKFLRDRVREVPGKHYEKMPANFLYCLLYEIPYPFSEYKTGRALRTSPIFTKLKAHGARFNQVMGYERPMYFKKEDDDVGFIGLESIRGDSESSSLTIATSNTFYKPSWFEVVKEEFEASRSAVSLCDYSSFAKMNVWSGRLEVVDFLQKMCSNDIDVPLGTIIHTGMHNIDGGYENDCTLARVAENRYFLMSPSIQQMRSYAWMRSHLPTNDTVFLQDVTSLYTTLCLMGPQSKAVLSKLTRHDLDSKSFPTFTIRHMDIGCAPDILTMNVTHTGELGYVFYIPNEFALHVFDAIAEAGKEFGIRQCGYYAMRALRIEKFFAFWGQDLDSRSTPLECGRAFRVKMDKNIDFIGKEALQRQVQKGIKKMLVMLLLDPDEHNYETDPWPWGGEPIYRDGQLVGSITTASYGFSLKKHVGIGFVHKKNENGKFDVVTPDYVRNGDYEVEIAGIRYPAKVRLQPPVLPPITGSKAQPLQGYQATQH